MSGVHIDTRGFPDDTDLRKKLATRARILNYCGWAVSGLAAIFLAVKFSNFSYYDILIMFLILIAGQTLRFYSKILKGRANSKVTAYSKRTLKKIMAEREQFVRNYFDTHKSQAEKVVLMEKLASKGKYKDAYHIAKSLLAKNPPDIIKNYLNNKIQKYSKILKGDKI